MLAIPLKVLPLYHVSKKVRFKQSEYKEIKEFFQMVDKPGKLVGVFFKIGKFLKLVNFLQNK